MKSIVLNSRHVAVEINDAPASLIYERVAVQCVFRRFHVNPVHGEDEVSAFAHCAEQKMRPLVTELNTRDLENREFYE